MVARCTTRRLHDAVWVAEKRFAIPLRLYLAGQEVFAIPLRLYLAGQEVFAVLLERHSKGQDVFANLRGHTSAGLKGSVHLVKGFSSVEAVRSRVVGRI